MMSDDNDSTKNHSLNDEPFSEKHASDNDVEAQKNHPLSVDEENELENTGKVSELEPGHDVMKSDQNFANEDDFLVTFDDADPARPQNWPVKKKVYHTMLYGLATFGAQFNSSALSPASEHIAAKFGVSSEVAILTTSLYVLGVGFGPMFFAPFSEVYGRKVGVFGPFALSIFLTMGSACSDSIASLLCTRFFAGLLAAAPVVSSGGVLADIWNPSVRAIALVGYAFFVVSGPAVGPVFSALATRKSDTSFRWPLWISVFINSAILIPSLFVIHETFVPVLLAKRAHKLRVTTRNFAYHAKHDEWSLSIKEFATVHLMRPVLMLGTPILFFVALYASFVFGLLYLFITTVPLTFARNRGWGYVVSQLPLLGMLVGVYFGGFANIMFSRRYAKVIQSNGGQAIPEERLPAMMACGWLMPTGLFIYAWTSDAKFPWIAPVIGIAMVGCGFFTIFQGCLNYIVDCYHKYAASAIAANTLGRSILGAVFPLFGKIMFENLGTNWAGTLLGCIAALLLPIPYVFYYFGKELRKKNPYAKQLT